MYVPPDVGYVAASCADEVALQYATTAAIPRPMSNAAPAACAAGTKTENTPAPIIEPRPMITASTRFRRRASAGWVGAAATCFDISGLAAAIVIRPRCSRRRGLAVPP